MTTLPGLSADQAAAVHGWFPGAELVADHGWGLVGRAVLQLRHGDQDVVVKAGSADDNHMAREITAHESAVGPLAERRLAPRLLHADRGLRLLATTYLPGSLVEGRPAEWDPEIYRQAGRLLAVLHAQGSRVDADYEALEDAKALAWLERPHRIDIDFVDRLRSELTTRVAGPSRLVPTHGDWQPRNWIVDGGRVCVIDFGRADWRPAETDLARLAAQQFRGRADLERAFLDGYGGDPRAPASWRRVRLREAFGTGGCRQLESAQAHWSRRTSPSAPAGHFPAGAPLARLASSSVTAPGVPWVFGFFSCLGLRTSRPPLFFDAIVVPLRRDTCRGAGRRGLVVAHATRTAGPGPGSTTAGRPSRSRPTFRRDLEVAAFVGGSRVTDRCQLDTGQPEMSAVRGCGGRGPSPPSAMV